MSLVLQSRKPLTHLGRRLRATALGALGIAVALGLWQVLTATKVLDPTAIPTMVRTFRTIGESLHTVHLWVGVGQTLEAAAIGFGIGASAGIVAGTVIGLNKFAYDSCFLVIEFFKTIPIIAVLPLAVLLYGTTLKMQAILVVFGVFFPTVIQTIYGVRAVDPVVRDTARAFNFGRVQRFFSVSLPSAAPFLATGIRLGVTGSLLLVIVAEVTAGGSGIGLQLLQAESAAAIGYSYALLIIIGCIGMLLVLAATAVERRVLAWHEVYRRSPK